MALLLLALFVWQAAETEPETAVWDVLPTSEQRQRSYPARALNQGVAGRATIRCRATREGLLSDCAISDEAPTGWGFGAAAVRLATTARVRPTTSTGGPVDGQPVVMNAAWTTSGATAPPPTQLITNPLWQDAPSRDDVSAAAPGDAEGLGVVRCSARATGRLYSCQVVAEEPRRGPFGEAAMSLSGRFQLASPGMAGEPVDGARVEYRVLFGVEAPVYVSSPRWLGGPEATEVQAALEPLARGAADRTAGATVDCEVVAGGALRGCRVIRATSAEAGVAVSALAGRFALSPWTEAGGSWVGARIRLPLSYVADE